MSEIRQPLTLSAGENAAQEGSSESSNVLSYGSTNREASYANHPPPYQPPHYPPQLPPQSQIVQYPTPPSFAPSVALAPTPIIVVQNAVLIGNRFIVPPPPYVPPILPTDPSLTSVIYESDSALLSAARIFRSLPQLTKQQLHNFCIAHSEVPKMVIHVEGYHETTTTRTDSKGRTTRTTTRTTDWEFSANPTPWIAGPGQQLGVEEAVSRFVDSTSKLKTLTITKAIKWDLPEFIKCVRALAREKGYPHNVAVEMKFENGSEKCVIEASNSFNDCVNSTPCKVLCFISCLCLLWAPIKYFSTDTFHVRDEYVMTLSPLEYLESIQHLIPVHQKSGCQIM